MSILIYGKVLFINGQIASSMTGGAKVINKSEFLGSTATFNIKNGIVTTGFGPEIEERAQKLGPFCNFLELKDKRIFRADIKPIEKALGLEEGSFMP